MSAPTGTSTAQSRCRRGTTARSRSRAPLRRLDDDDLVALLDASTADTRAARGEDWTRAKMDPARFAAMTRAITGFELPGERGARDRQAQPEQARRRCRGRRRRARRDRPGRRERRRSARRADDAAGGVRLRRDAGRQPGQHHQRDARELRGGRPSGTRRSRDPPRRRPEPVRDDGDARPRRRRHASTPRSPTPIAGPITGCAPRGRSRSSRSIRASATRSSRSRTPAGRSASPPASPTAASP